MATTPTPAELSAERNRRSKEQADKVNRTRTTEKQKNTLFSSMYGSMEDEARALLKQREQIEQNIAAEKNALREFDAVTGSGGFYEEDPDVGLMRALAAQLENEPVGPYSNVAAQLSMIEDPNFAGVYDRAVNARINAARKHFSRMGTVARMAQSGRQAQRQSRSRSRQQNAQRLKGFQDQLKRVEDSLFGIRKETSKRDWQEKQGDKRHSRIMARDAGRQRPGLNRHTVQASRLVELQKAEKDLEKARSLDYFIDGKISDQIASQENLPQGASQAEVISIFEERRRLAQKAYSDIRNLPSYVTEVPRVQGQIPGGGSTGGGWADKLTENKK